MARPEMFVIVNPASSSGKTGQRWAGIQDRLRIENAQVGAHRCDRLVLRPVGLTQRPGFIGDIVMRPTAQRAVGAGISFRAVPVHREGAVQLGSFLADVRDASPAPVLDGRISAQRAARGPNPGATFFECRGKRRCLHAGNNLLVHCLQRNRVGDRDFVGAAHRDGF